jgi:uncharacterized membrane protein YesL
MDRREKLKESFLRFLRTMGDLMLLNWLLFFCCLPVVTLGPACCATYSVTLRLARGEHCHTVRCFFQAFRENFKKGLVLGLIAIVLAVLSVGDYLFALGLTGSMQKVYTALAVLLLAVLLTFAGYGFALQAMFEKIMILLPRMLVAAAVLFIGLRVADLIRKAVSGLVVISRLDALGEHVGVSRVFGNGGLAKMMGVVVYGLAAIPVLIIALTSLQIDSLTQSISGFLDQLLNASGDIIGAGGILFIAVLAGGVTASVATKLSAGFGVDKLAEELGIKSCHGKNAPLSVWIGNIEPRKRGIARIFWFRWVVP